MTLADIKELEKYIGIKLKDLPYLEMRKEQRTWKFKDSRTYKGNDGYTHVFPIGFSHNYVYLINPFTGDLKKNGLCRGDYQGHRSEGYIIDRLDDCPILSIADIKSLNRLEIIVSNWRKSIGA
jgi:hypothetical protein